MATRALLLTRADSASGYEHLQRTLTLAGHLAGQRGFGVKTVLMGDEKSLQHCRELGLSVVFFPAWELKLAVRRHLLAQLLRGLYLLAAPHLLVFDGYDFSDTYWGRSFFADLFPNSVFFGLDIYRHRDGAERPEREPYQPVNLQWIVNSLHAPFGRQESREGNARVFFGTDYLILPPTIARAPRWRPTDDAPVAVYLHGRAARATHRLLSVLAEAAFSEHRFHIFTDHSELFSHYISPRIAISEPVPQERFLAAFTGSLFGITSAGFSLCELAHLGVPLIIVPVSLAEYGSAEKFIEQGFGELVTAGSLGFKSRLRAALTRMSDEALRKRYSECGRKLIDDRGLSRVGDLMAQAAAQATVVEPENLAESAGHTS